MYTDKIFLIHYEYTYMGSYHRWNYFALNIVDLYSNGEDRIKVCFFLVHLWLYETSNINSIYEQLHYGHDVDTSSYLGFNIEMYDRDVEINW